MLSKQKPGFSQYESLLRLSLTAISFSILSASWLYSRGWEHQVIHCYFQDFLGFIGPGCGLTRSVAAFVQGRWLLSIKYHLFGPIILLVASLLLPWSIISLSTRQPTIPQVIRQRQVVILITLSCGFTFLFLGYYDLRCLALYFNTLIPSGIEELSIWGFLTESVNLL